MEGGEPGILDLRVGDESDDLALLHGGADLGRGAVHQEGVVLGGRFDVAQDVGGAGLDHVAPLALGGVKSGAPGRPLAGDILAGRRGLPGVALAVVGADAHFHHGNVGGGVVSGDQLDGVPVGAVGLVGFQSGAGGVGVNGDLGALALLYPFGLEAVQLAHLGWPKSSTVEGHVVNEPVGGVLAGGPGSDANS